MSRAPEARLSFGRPARSSAGGQLRSMAFLLVAIAGLMAWLGHRGAAAEPAVAVEVTGDVAAPGWVEPSQPTVHAAVLAAGGDPTGLPDARLEPGTRLVVTGGAVRLERAEGRLVLALPIDINSASARALGAIPGLGDALATSIVAERERGGAFESVEALARVRGVGASTVEQLRPFVEARGK